ARLDLLPLLPGWLHALALCAFAGGFAYLSARVWARYQPPTDAQAARRLERDSGLAHQPLAALDDRMAGGGDDPVSRALWAAHLRRVAETVRSLRLGWPSPGMAARDPHGLRAAVLLLVIVATTVGWHDAGRRLERALVPDIDTPRLAPDSVEVWITPPAYTGAPPVLLKPGQQAAAPTAVPAGSTVLAVVAGGWGTASLVVDGHEVPFQPQAGGGQRIETHIENGSLLEILQAGFTVASWPLKVMPDALPSIAFTDPPAEGERGRLRLQAAASDDYGLARAWVEIRRAEAPDGEVLTAELPLPANRPRAAETSSWHDFTPHPWAGLPVTIQPRAADALGQEAAGESVTTVLPERSFTHPTARILVEQRRAVTEDRDNAPDAAAVLDRIATEPAMFEDDLKVFLAIRAARHALMGDFGFDLAEVQDLLWNAALRLEDGDLADAERALEQARRALENALDQDAPAAELDRLLSEFQQAMARYLDALAQRMAEAGTPPTAADPDATVVTDEDMARMMQSMRDMADTGARDALRRMLRDLDQLLANLETAPAAPVPPEAAQAMRDLDDITRRQQRLLDQSFQQGRQGGGQQGARTGRPGTEGGSAGSAAGAATAQQGLRRGLGEVMRNFEQGMGGTPAPLADADAAMAEAADALARGQWDAAAEAQGRALDQLRQGSREAMEQMGMAGPGGMGMVPRDPLGRPMNGFGFGDDGSTEIPDRAEVQRSREILEELRRRSGEWSRPEPERDYLRRLLKTF
ncbi:MAG: TIGR02302 family protein, partial [Pseudomonadota bacterium]